MIGVIINGPESKYDYLGKQIKVYLILEEVKKESCTW